MKPAGGVELRDLKTLDECRDVVRLQEDVWGHDGEVVPATVLFVSAKRGGILIGGYDRGALAGFVWSMPGTRADVPRTHWSHMLGVRQESRQRGLGELLKWAQRDRALAQGVPLIEWTFDPLQAANAHFNLHVLGGVGAAYAVNIYGELQGPLHRGTPTDRLIVEWWTGDPGVEARAAAAAQDDDDSGEAGSAFRGLRAAIQSASDGRWVRVRGVEAPTDPVLLVPVPPDFLAMQQQATDVALEWRLAVREVMHAALARGYRAADFLLDRTRGGGAYVLVATSN